MRRICALAVVCYSAYALPSPAWRLTKSPHFEVYSQADDAAARSTLLWFEQLRAFFVQQTGQQLDRQSPVRVIAFRSATEYQAYQLRSASDGYFAIAGSRVYIVMVTMGGSEFRVAAHEYAHAILHARGLQLPPWLNEGLAEFFSTIHVGEHGVTLGGDLPSHSSLLRRSPWMPLSEMLAMPEDSPLRNARDSAGLYY